MVEGIQLQELNGNKSQPSLTPSSVILMLLHNKDGTRRNLTKGSQYIKKRKFVTVTDCYCLTGQDNEDVFLDVTASPS
jgi:hypothetical protein